jgi:glycerol-3-phosphate acyltransferase PlsY
VTVLRITAVLVGAYLLGAIPFSQMVARWTAGVDLRRTGTGTVSGTAVYKSAGFGPVAVAGILDILKGVAAVLPMAGTRPVVAAVAGGLAVVGHNWSVFLGGAGGRGIAPALGATIVLGPVGTVVLGLGLALGRIVGRTGLGSFASQALLIPVLAVVDGSQGFLLGSVLVVPMWVKRMTGNRLPGPPKVLNALHRLAFDHDRVAPKSEAP